MKKTADFFIFITAALVIPPTIKDLATGFYEHHSTALLLGSIGIGALIGMLNSAKIEESNSLLYRLKHIVFTTRNITLFLLCALLIGLATAFALPFFHLAIPTNSVLYSATIAVIYILFLIVSDQIPFSRFSHTVVHYYGIHPKMNDFHAVGGGIWDETSKTEKQPFATGRFKIDNNIIVIERTNLDGRYKITLKNFPYKRKPLTYIPIDSFQEALRTFDVTCEVCSNQGVHHTLVFAFADADNHNWFQSSREEVVSTVWRKVELSLTASGKSKLKFRIDDIEVGAPSGVSIRKLKITEKV